MVLVKAFFAALVSTIFLNTAFAKGAEAPTRRAARIETMGLALERGDLAQTERLLGSIENSDQGLPYLATFRAVLTYKSGRIQESLDRFKSVPASERDADHFAFYFFALTNSASKSTSLISDVLEKQLSSPGQPSVAFMASAEAFLEKNQIPTLTSLFCRKVLTFPEFQSGRCRTKVASWAAPLLDALFGAEAHAEVKTKSFTSFLSRDILQMAPIRRMLHSMTQSILGTRKKAEGVEMCMEPLSQPHLAGGNHNVAVARSPIAGLVDHVFLHVKNNDQDVIWETNSGGTDGGYFNKSFSERKAASCQPLWIPNEFSDVEFAAMLSKGAAYLKEKYRFNYNFAWNNCGSYAMMMTQCLGASVGYTPNLAIFSRWRSRGAWTPADIAAQNAPTYEEYVANPARATRRAMAGGPGAVSGEEVCRDLQRYVGYSGSSSAPNPTPELASHTARSPAPAL